jgi:hypothetical protein
MVRPSFAQQYLDLQYPQRKTSSFDPSPLSPLISSLRMAYPFSSLSSEILTSCSALKRPGVLEAHGFNPSKLLAHNKRLIIARLTGFRRYGKYSKMVGHDINYLAVSGILSRLGRRGAPPYSPANILADFAGGGLMCGFGIIIALFVWEKTGRG